MKKAVFFTLIFCCIFLFGQKPQQKDISLKNLNRQENPSYNSITDTAKAKDIRWQSLGPHGGNVAGLAVHPQKKKELYAISSDYPGGVYKSINSGKKWTKITTLYDSLYDIAIDPLYPNTLYVLSYNYVYKSVNSGKNWNSYRLGTNCYGQEGKIAINPINSSIIYACGFYYYNRAAWKDCMAVFKSTNGGKTWKLIKFGLNSKPSNSTAYCVAINPKNPNIVYCSGYFYDSKWNYYYKVYKSSNGGKNWQDKSGGIKGTPYSIVIDPKNPSKIYVGTLTGVYRSSNSGESWQKNNGLVYSNDLAIDPTNRNILYSGYDDSCYKSTDGGVNWTKHTKGVKGECTQLLAFSASPTQLFYASNAGIYKSLNQGNSFKASHSGIKANKILSLTKAPSSPNTVYAGAEDNALFTSKNSGKSWARLPSFPQCHGIKKIIVHPTNPNIIFILTGG